VCGTVDAVTQQRTFRISKGVRLFVQTMAALLGAPALYGVGYYSLELVINPIPSSMMLVICGGFSLACAYFAYCIQRSGVILAPDAAYVRRWHYTRQIPYGEIAGWRLCLRPRRPPFLQIIPTAASEKPITIDGGHDNQAELEEWVKSFPDLTVDEELQALQEVERDVELGATPAERRATLAQGRKLAQIINVIGGATLIWAYLFPYPYDVAMVLASLVPVAALWALTKFKTIVAFEWRAKRAEEYGFTMIFICAPGILAYRASKYVQFEYEPDDFAGVLIAAILLTAIILLLVRRRRVSLPSKAFILLGCFVYAFGLVSYINVQLDTSRAQVVRTVVTSKPHYKESQGWREYHVEVRGWPDMPTDQTKRIEVSRYFYEQTEVDQPACAYLRSGLARMKWYVVGKCPL
jgi:hypothetical protein